MIPNLLRSPDPIARRALDLYRAAPPRDRLHLRVRWATCPVPAVEEAVPRHGRILELGCGHGLVASYLALSGPRRAVLGTDIDARKIALAAAAARRIAPGEGDLRFEHAPDGALPPGPWSAIVVVDVLYLLDATREAALLERCAAALAPGGVLVLKETDRDPAWKYALTKAQELVSTRVLRITAGDALSFTPMGLLASLLERQGLRATVSPVDRGHLHPHSLLVARRP